MLSLFISLDLWDRLDQVLRIEDMGKCLKPWVTRDEMAGRQMLRVANDGSSMKSVEGVVEFPNHRSASYQRWKAYSSPFG